MMRVVRFIGPVPFAVGVWAYLVAHYLLSTPSASW